MIPFVDRRAALTAAATLALLGGAGTSAAHASLLNWSHAGTFNVANNLPAGEPASTETSAEIVDATRDGRTLIYTNALTERIEFVDITNPKRPAPKGVLDMGGEPTSVAVAGRYALVAVNTSPSFVAPSGELVVVDPATQTIVTRFPLGGQPDSIAVAPSGRYAAIVIENERDEDLNGGLIPQAPAGSLLVLDLRAPVGLWGASLRTVDLTGLAATAPEDPEPEFVDINDRDEAVVSLQENNHLAIVDLRRAAVTRHFSAGTASALRVDATEEKLGPQRAGDIQLTEDVLDRRREPDAVHWIDNDTFLTANEGDYEDADGVEGGSRGVTIFGRDGKVKWDSGSSLEHEMVRAGHFPMDRAENKGVEPEGLEVAKFLGTTYLFAGAERANAVAIYAMTRRGPQFRGILPTGRGPEGLRAIPSRGLLAVSAETDDPALARSLVTTYQLGFGAPKYPQLVSKNDAAGTPVPWVAMSGLSGDPRNANRLWAVSDSIMGQAYMYAIDARRSPATIERRIPIGRAVSPDQTLGEFDLEGIAARPEGGFWVASEGRVNVGSSRPNLIVRIAGDGSVLQSVPLPAELVAGATSSGLEGVAVTGTAKRGNETVYVAIQREWKDDPAGSVKLGKYDVATGTWTFVRYALDPVASPAGGWVGLSEITILPDGRTAIIIERDNQLGDNARIKRLYKVDLRDPKVAWKPFGAALDTTPKRLVRDVIGDLDARSITVPDKLEGAGLTRDGRLFLATDNDGLDGNYGETLFFPVGRLR